MRHSMWAYPWDLQDLGLDTTYHDYNELAGVNGISLAVSYHAGRFLQPRSLKRKSYYPEDGTIYFIPDEKLWADKEIQPLVARNLHESDDMLSPLINDRKQHGLSVSCWTVCLHNSRLGFKHPEHVARNAFGDPSYYSLCPNSDAVRDYATTLVANLTHSYRPDIVELETIGFMGFDHGYHHEKDGLGLNAEDDFLLSICFCDHCIKAAQDAGVDALSAKKDVQNLIIQACNRETPEAQFPHFPEQRLECFKDYTALYTFLQWRTQAPTKIVQSIKEATHPDSKILVIEGENAWRDGVDIKAISQKCDGIILCAYTATAREISNIITKIRDLLGSDKYLGLGVSLFYDHTPTAEQLSGRIETAVKAGADGVNYYNYGLVPQARLGWIKSCIEGCD
ncbi:hypothetical protein [Kiloniella sp. EL199]|uniref:hypothetical protein n=1 Tax=Kiloniella sp. EL199 TaxID=2107581 RepID=UPI000EA2A0B0|nr:hypothetical protein [Kiloniella sp. EL199]